MGKINPFSDILGKTKPFFHFQLRFEDYLSILLDCYFCTSFISMCNILSPFLKDGSAQSENRQETTFKEPLYEKTSFLCENKSADQLFSTFAFAKQIEQGLCFHNSKIKPLALFFGCTVSSSSKGNIHSPESHYKSIVTFKMLNGS